jgi:hypothetical protein
MEWATPVPREAKFAEPAPVKLATKAKPEPQITVGGGQLPRP